MYEFILQETYYLPIRGKTPKGKLVDKYKNRKRLLNTELLTEAKKKKKSNVKNSEILKSEPNAVSIQQQLLYFKDLVWEEVKDLWKQSKNFRRNQLQQDSSENTALIVKCWPCYKHPAGHVLVGIN